MRRILSFFMQMLPAGVPTSIYKKLLSLPPLRAITNRALIALLPERITIPEGVLSLHPRDPVISGALTFGIYEPFETALFRKLLAPGMTVVDIGANIGYYTVIAARAVGPDGIVIAFEPEPENAALLLRNISQNNFTNASVETSALADKEGEMELHLSDANKGNHSLVATGQHSAQFSSSVTVRVETLDAALVRRGISRVDIIKMDVEGAEALALAGMRRTLASPDLAMLIEFFPDAIRRSGAEPSAVLHTITGLGFTVLELEENRKKTAAVGDLEAFAARFGRGEYANLLCVKGSFLKYRSG